MPSMIEKLAKVVQLPGAQAHRWNVYYVGVFISDLLRNRCESFDMWLERKLIAFIRLTDVESSTDWMSDDRPGRIVRVCNSLVIKLIDARSHFLGTNGRMNGQRLYSCWLITASPFRHTPSHLLNTAYRTIIRNDQDVVKTSLIHFPC